MDASALDHGRPLQRGQATSGLCRYPDILSLMIEVS